MSTITSIQVQKNRKDRVNIFVDDEFFLGANIELIYKFSIKKGQEIDKKVLEELLLENDKIECLNKAVSYCSKGLKTEKQVKTSLYNKGFSTKTILYVIEKLKENKYIDDYQFVKRYFESTSRRQGVRLAKQRLILKGVDEQIINDCLLELEIDSSSNCYNLLEKYLKNKPNTNETFSKAFRYLLSKGFSYEDVDSAISKYKEEN